MGVRKSYGGAAVATTLNGAIAGGATTIVVTNGTTYPDGSGGPFVICIDRGLGTEEKVLIATRTGNSMAVTTRGYDGTSGVGHSNLAPVEHVLDAVTVDEANQLSSVLTTRGDMIVRGATVAQRLALGANGQLYGAGAADPGWINPPIIAAAAIVELATTPVPVPNVADTVAFSTLHRALMYWTGTQWRFVNGVPRYLLDAYVNWSIATGLIATIQGEAGHLAIAQASNANGVANSGYRIHSVTGSGVGMAGLRHRQAFRLPTSIATRTTRIGFLDTTDQSDATDGMYVEIANLTASFKTAQGGTRTTNGTTAVLVANTWYTVHVIQLTTTTVRCIIVNDAGTVVLDVTNVANVPSGSQVFQSGWNSTRSDAVASAALVDISEQAYGYAAI